MDLRSPIQTVIPSAHGAVLAVLARTDVPLSGRQVAELTGSVSRSGAQLVLSTLVESGLVLVEEHPPARLYRLNRSHVAAEPVIALASLRSALIERLRDHVDAWTVPAIAVWLFGSAARGDGTVSSDLDVFVVRPDALSDEDPAWRVQLAQLADQATSWSGNGCEVVEVSEAELEQMVEAGERLVDELRADAVALTGTTSASLLRRAVQGS